MLITIKVMIDRITLLLFLVKSILDNYSIMLNKPILKLLSIKLTLELA